MEYRVEGLAAATGIPVDTIRFYQARHLLSPPRRAGRIALYDDHHVEALRRIKELQERGFSLGVIGRILRGELDAADEALVEAVALDRDAPQGPSEQFLTLAELAERSGVPVVLLDALEREDVLVPRRLHGEARYTESDLVALSAGLKLLEHGLPLGDVLELARLHREAARTVAERAVELFEEHVRQVQRGAPEGPARLVEAFHALLPATVSLVAHHFRRILLAVAQEHIESVGDDDERSAVETAALRRLEPPIASWE